MRYSPLNHRPKSIVAHCVEQNGRRRGVSDAGRPQTGQLRVVSGAVRSDRAGILYDSCPWR